MSKAYPSNLTLAQYELISDLIPDAKPGGRKREVNMWEVLNGIFYILVEGVRWRSLPGDFPPWQTVYTYFRNWRKDGTWLMIHDNLLKNITTPLVLGLDDIDKIFPYTEIAQEFFTLLRAWHEKGKNEEVWQKLRLVIAHSQEVYVSLNVNQSPFNVGLSVEIGEFNNTQIQELVQRHQLNWSDTEFEKLRGMIDGHPYLLRTALYHIATGNLSLADFLKVAATDEGLFSGFLRPYLSVLEEDRLLKTAMQKVIKSDVPVKLDAAQSFKLRSLGLIEFKGNDVQCLCNLYRLYFGERLAE